MKNTQAIQCVNYRRMEYEEYQDLVRDKAGVTVAIKVFHDRISIRAKDYTEYVLARSVLRQRCSKPIVMDVFGQDFEEKEADVNTTHPPRTEGA